MRYFQNRTMKSKLSTGLFSAFLLSSSLFAGDVASMEKTQTGVFWTPNSGVKSVSLRVVGPNGFSLEKECDTTDISVTEFGSDGLYKYELVANKSMNKRLRTMIKDRNSIETTSMGRGEGLKESGHFRVVDGQPMVDTVEEK